MKKSIITFCGLLFFAAQSCDVLDKEPIELSVRKKRSQTPMKRPCQSYCNNLYPDLISGHGPFNGYSFGMLEGDFQSDNILPWDANTVAFSQHTISTKDDNWKWEIVRACNAFMEYYELAPVSESVKQRYARRNTLFQEHGLFQ